MIRGFALIASCLALSACSRDEPDAVHIANFECTPPAQAEYGAWSKSGSNLSCKIAHGPFVAWEDGYVHVRGEFDMGKKSGVWRWYDRNGAVVTEVDHSAAAAQAQKD